MGTTAQKLEYLGTTKSQLKDMINYGLDENKITSSTTFRNYVSSIFNAFLEALRTPDTLFTNLPKKSASGSNISLTGTANAPMRITLGATELSQSGTPTPSSPQAVHTISGSNTIRVKNANVLNPNTFVSSTYITGINNNTSVITFTPNTTFIIPTIFDNMNLEAGEYTIYCEVLTGAYTGGNMLLYDANNTKYTEWAFKNSDTHIFNLNATNGIKTIKLWNPTNEVITTIKLWIAKGTYTSTTMPTYEPYISQEADIDLPVENKFNINATRTNNNTTNSVVGKNLTISTTSTWASMDYLNIALPNNTYTLSFDWESTQTLSGTDARIYVYDSATATSSLGAFSPTGTSGHSTFTFTNTNNVISLRFSPNNSATAKTISMLFTNIMLNVGSEEKEYTEYGKALEYCKISTYEDKFIRTSGKNLVEVGTLNDYEQPNGTTPSYLTISNDTLSMVIQSGGGTRFYKKDHYTQIGNFTINSITSVTNARYFLRIRKLDNSGWMTNSDATITGWNYNQYFDGWYVNTTSSSNEKSFTIPECLYWQIGFGWDTQSYQGTTQTMFYIMLNEGTTALPYEPYGSNEWYIKKNIGKVVLDGTEDYVKRSDIPNLTNTSCFRTSVNANINANAIPNVQQMCDKFICLNNTNDTEHIRYTGAENYRFQIFIDKTRLGSDDASGMKTWATNNNMIIYYPIIPTYTQITGTLAEQLEYVYQKLLSYSGTTNISQVNNDLPFIMSVSAIEV